MSDDEPKGILERYLHSPPLQPSNQITKPTLVVHREDAYSAFSAQDKVIRLHIRRANGIAHTIAYSFLSHFDYNYQTLEEFTLIAGLQSFTVTGRNLGPVIDAIAMHKCAWIQEYIASLHGELPTDAPVIARIVVDLDESASPNSDAA